MICGKGLIVSIMKVTITDFEKVYEMLNSLGVPMRVDGDDVEGKDILISVKSSRKSKVRGYTGFYTYYSFNADGSFSHIGIYE